MPSGVGTVASPRELVAVRVPGEGGGRGGPGSTLFARVLVMHRVHFVKMH